MLIHLQRPGLSSDPHQMPLDSPPAVHQPTHLGQVRLPVVSGQDDRLGVIAEALPLGGTRDLLIEPFARVCETVELRNQLLLAPLVQGRHHLTDLTSTRSLMAFASSRASNDLTLHGQGSRWDRRPVVLHLLPVLGLGERLFTGSIAWRSHQPLPDRHRSHSPSCWCHRSGHSKASGDTSGQSRESPQSS